MSRNHTSDNCSDIRYHFYLSLIEIKLSLVDDTGTSESVPWPSLVLDAAELSWTLDDTVFEEPGGRSKLESEDTAEPLVLWSAESVLSLRASFDLLCFIGEPLHLFELESVSWLKV